MAPCGCQNGGGRVGGTLLDIEDRELQVVRFGDEPLKADTLEHVVGSPLAGHLWMVAGFGAALGPDVSEQVHEIVLLTGADQAAVVGAYRAIKQIVANHAGAPLSVGIIIAGSSPSVSEDVWTRLSGTFREHLGIEATLVGVLSQLDVDTPATRVTVAMPSEGLPLLLTTLRARPTGLNPSDHASLAMRCDSARGIETCTDHPLFSSAGNTRFPVFTSITLTRNAAMGSLVPTMAGIKNRSGSI